MIDQTVFVDGYNILNSWVEARFLMPGELDFTREQLVRHLSSCFAFWGSDCWLVFDAHLVKGGRGNSEPHGEHLRIIFTVEGQTADSFIERSVDEMRTLGKQVTVCTSDWEEQNIVLTRGAHRMSARDLLWRVKRAELEMSNLSKHPKPWQKSWLEDNLPGDVRETLRKMRDKKGE